MTPATFSEVVHGAGTLDGFDVRIAELPKGTALPPGRVRLWDEVETGEPS